MVSSSLWQNCEENLVGGVRVRLVHIKKSHNFAVKKGRVAHILVPFMVGAICGLPLAGDPNLDSNQEKNTYEIHSHHPFPKVFFSARKNRSEIGTIFFSTFWQT